MGCNNPLRVWLKSGIDRALDRATTSLKVKPFRQQCARSISDLCCGFLIIAAMNGDNSFENRKACRGF